jgi:hypothetical protein
MLFLAAICFLAGWTALPVVMEQDSKVEVLITVCPGEPPLSLQRARGMISQQSGVQTPNAFRYNWAWRRCGCYYTDCYFSLRRSQAANIARSRF